MLPRMTAAPIARTSSGWSAFTVAFVPTGMNAGVGMSPCAVWTTPARAAPSVGVEREAGDASQDQHRVAEGVEPVPLLDRDPVQVARRSTPAKAITSARSVERGRWKFVRSASTRAELEARQDEEARCGLRAAVAGDRLEHAHRRRADGEHASAAAIRAHASGAT